MKKQFRFDSLALHPIGGFFLFFTLLFLLFEGTFFLGSFPMSWIEKGVELLSNSLNTLLPQGPVKDLLIEGIIGGVGGVIVFLPNILLLFTFISIMETSGYMARAALLMDKIMHKIGLSGHSFVPLIMGFGCNVPAILAAKGIADWHSRMITIMINPLMSCSARLPVYILLTGTFFSQQAGLIIFLIYLTGIVLAISISAFLGKFIISTADDVPLDLTLPRYRFPNVRHTLSDVWLKTQQYLKKMAGIIMLASIAIWFLGYYPLHSPHMEELNDQKQAVAQSTTLSHPSKTAQLQQLDALLKADHESHSYIGRIGQWAEPLFAPLGFNWKITTALLTGIAGKELIVSTLGVLYASDDDSHHSLTTAMRNAETTPGTKDFTPAIAISLLIFVLIYFPCLPTVVAIKNGTGRWKWSLFSIAYTTLLAWGLSFIVYSIITHFA